MFISHTKKGEESNNNDNNLRNEMTSNFKSGAPYKRERIDFEDPGFFLIQILQNIFHTSSQLISKFII